MAQHHTVFGKIFDLVDVPAAFVASVAIANIHQILGIIAFCCSIGYTLWKWTSELKEKYQDKPKTKKK